jgi:ADP-heptose:LPS heptosyltransferase
VEKPVDSPDVEPQAEAMLVEFKQHLPEDTVYFVPWKWNRYEPDGLEFGLRIPQGARPTSDMPVIKHIDFKCQLLEYLEPTQEGERAFRQIVPDERRLIAIFPRCRVIRRADKNWSREKYVELIQRLQSAWRDYLVAIFGEPGGAYFADGVPAGCIDLINVSSNHRMDIQIAALKRCVMALGSMSGAMLVALAAGCPALIWGFASSQARYHRENFMGTPMIYYTELDPSVNTVFELSQALQLMLQNWTSQLASRRAWE